ncbi:hypothetical protein EZE99_24035, partial [Escherichia coli]|nr:hypothetical protein [Escherichia coli]
VCCAERTIILYIQTDPYQSNQDSGALFKMLHQVNNELHDLLDSLENHTPLVRKNADELIALLLLFTRQVGQSRTDLI